MAPDAADLQKIFRLRKPLRIARPMRLVALADRLQNSVASPEPAGTGLSDRGKK
jgi:hypothetical protein